MVLTQEYKDRWANCSKIVFRFVFTYLALYILLFFFSKLFEHPFIWIGKNVLGIAYDFDTSGHGSGDHTYAYITLFVNVIAALISGFVWSIFDRKRVSYNQLFYWFTVLLRVYLVVFMLMYGFVKVFKIQFPEPSLLRLLEPLGDFSPMGLAWTYMGYSEGYSFFTGALEVLGGLLLIPRRTQTLGALLVMGVMTHVAVMNFAFDIPVKLFSIHLVLMAMLLFFTDSNRFLNVFVNNKAVASYSYYHPIKDDHYHKIVFWSKTVVLVIIFVAVSILGYNAERTYGDKRDKPALYGIWETEMFIKNKDTLPPLVTDESRWRYLVVDKKGKASIKLMNDSVVHYTFNIDTTKQKLSMFHKKDSLHKNLKFKQLQKESLSLKGILHNDTLNIQFKLIDHNKFLLKSRGFNWINEKPFNK